MSTLNVEGIKNTSASSNAITLATDGTCTAKVTNNLSNRNVIQNGAMEVAQRSTSVAITGGGYHTVDRWQTVANSSMTYAVTMSQEDDGPPGFRKSLKLLTTAAKTPSGSENYILRTRLEEYDIYRFDYGRSSCKEATVSWWVKSNKTGTYSNQWYLKRNGSGDISMTTSYTIDTANTWEKKSTVIPVYTTSFSHVTGTACGLMMDWHLASGPDDITGAFSWTGQGAARAVTGQVNILDTVNNYFQITGIQLEVGSTPTDFEHIRYGEELSKCQRYCRVYGGNASYERIGIGYFSNTTRLECPLTLAPQMRTTPSLTVSSAGHWKAESPSGSGEFTAVGLDGNSSNQVAIVWGDKSNTFTAGESGRFLTDNTTDARITLNADP